MCPPLSAIDRVNSKRRLVAWGQRFEKESTRRSNVGPKEPRLPVDIKKPPRPPGVASPKDSSSPEEQKNTKTQKKTKKQKKKKKEKKKKTNTNSCTTQIEVNE